MTTRRSINHPRAQINRQNRVESLLQAYYERFGTWRAHWDIGPDKLRTETFRRNGKQISFVFDGDAIVQAEIITQGGNVYDLF